MTGAALPEAIRGIKESFHDDDAPGAECARSNFAGPMTLFALVRYLAERRELELRTETIVAHLGRTGVGWGQIGRALGVSRQAARQRYGTRTWGAAHVTTRVVVLGETSVCRREKCR